jgi:hypothetical protein
MINETKSFRFEYIKMIERTYHEMYKFYKFRLEQDQKTKRCEYCGM